MPQREDPRRAVIDVIAGLGRETQYHLDQRIRHFRITDTVIVITSVLLVILAVFNVYYVRVLYQDFDGIVSNMESMHDHLVNVDADMEIITLHMQAFEGHMEHMAAINAHTGSLAETMPKVRADMKGIAADMDHIQQSMHEVAHGMGFVDQRVGAMAGGVSAMREGMGQFARPASGMMPFMP